MRNETNVHIRIKTDNTTAVSYINNFGGVKSLRCFEETRKIWLWAIQQNNHISAEHLPGAENSLADKASRVFDLNTEWELCPHVYQKVEDIYGQFDIDLFASRLNSKNLVYASWKPDPKAVFVDAFSAVWNQFNNFYAFPPFSIIMKCLQKIVTDQATGLIIVPLWPTQPWFPKLMKMLIDIPVILPLNILKLPFNKQILHKQHKNLRLVACPLSGISSLNEDFLRNPSILCVPPGEQVPCFNMKYISENGHFSVIGNKLIPCHWMKLR